MKAILRKTQASEPYSFVFLDSQGKTLLKSENYKAKDSARNGIESVKKNCSNDARYELKKARNGKVFFNLKAANGQIVGTSAMFSSQTELDAAIAMLKSNAPNTSVEEQ